MPSDINRRAASYFIACALQRCGCCRKLTSVVGLIVPAGHETLEFDSASDASAVAVWEIAEANAILFDVENLSDAVQNRLRQFAPHYAACISEVTGSENWLNHCNFCGAQQADFDLYCEPEGAFMPISPAAAARIRLVNVCELFAARVSGYGYVPEFLEYALHDPQLD
jgi:hypothetical protein